MTKRAFTRKIKSAYNKAKPAVLSAGAMLAVTAGNASAAAFDGTVTLDTAPVDTLMVAVAAGLASLWGYRKFIKTTNRS